MAKTSNTAVGIVAPIAAYADSKEVSDVASQYLKVINAGVVGAVSAPSNSLASDELALEAAIVQDDTVPVVDSPVLGDAPTLADIEIISNTVVYDVANNPTATVIFKVRNSSKKIVKGIKVKVQAV